MADLYRKSEINEMKKRRRVAYSAKERPVARIRLHVCRSFDVLFDGY